MNCSGRKLKGCFHPQDILFKWAQLLLDRPLKTTEHNHCPYLHFIVETSNQVHIYISYCGGGTCGFQNSKLLTNYLTLTNTIIWDISQCNQLNFSWCFGGNSRLNIQGWRIRRERMQCEIRRQAQIFFDPEYGGDIFFRNVGLTFKGLHGITSQKIYKPEGRGFDTRWG
jgi:hypothetical protein